MQQTVEARDLYIGLGLARAEWSRWAARNIEADTFFSENKDSVGFVVNTNGNDTRGYSVAIEFAKHLAMMARTERAHDYRNYFIECERRALAPAVPVELSRMDLIEMAMAAERECLAAEAKVQQLEHKVADHDQAPAVAGFNLIANADGTLCLRDAAKALQMQPFKLTGLLLEKKWMYHRLGKPGYVAYQDKIQAGHLKHKMGNYEDPESGERKVNEQVRVMKKGLTKLAEIIAADAVARRVGDHDQLQFPWPGQSES